MEVFSRTAHITGTVMQNTTDSILVIDDDRELCELLTEYFRPEGFEIVSAYNGASGLELALAKKFSIIILDIMLPGGMNGFDVLQTLRAKTSIPVIMLTARGDDVDRIVGLEMGADDYLPKPFNTRELLARIHAILRRSRVVQQGNLGTAAKKYQFADLELDTGARVVTRSGETVKLTNVEFHLLEVLMRNCGKVVSRDDLANEVLYRELSPFDRSVDVHVSKLRKKIGNEAGGGERIKAIRGTGYVFVCSSLGGDEPENMSEN